VAPDLQGSLARLAAIRRHEIHRLTTRLATTHGRIVVEGLDAAGMLRQHGSPGARARRRGARRCRPGRGPAAAARQDRLGVPIGTGLKGSPWMGPREGCRLSAIDHSAATVLTLPLDPVIPNDG